MLRFALISLCFLAQPVWADAPDRSLRPISRPAATGEFATCLTDIRAEAIRKGVRPAVANAALGGLRFDTRIIEQDRKQEEFTKTVWVYLDTAVSADRIRLGKAALRNNATLLNRIEARYGVEKEILAAIWGLESAYGAVRGSTPVIHALATLACDDRRRDFFRDELIAALAMVQRGDVAPGAFKGSWAGASGHMQFMPSSYAQRAVDFDGDGHKNIWANTPADALASAANYLKRNGWTKGQPWGVEVTLPKGFDLTLARRDLRKSPVQWAALGIRPAYGRAIRNHGPASILLPGGAKGAAFMIFDNFEVLESYNTADAYVIGVGHLADRLKGGPAIKSGWPRGDRALTLSERIELQKRLTSAGFDPQKIDGKIGPLTINAVRAWQQARGLVPDGYPSPAMLSRLRQE